MSFFFTIGAMFSPISEFLWVGNLIHIIVGAKLPNIIDFYDLEFIVRVPAIR
jgi:hypothetical protein